MSETTQQSTGELGTSPGGGPGGTGGATASLWRGASMLLRQRELTVFVVAVALFLYFLFSSGQVNTAFIGQTNLINLLSTIAAPIIIIALGEVMLLISGEIDLSVGFIYTLAPYIMYFTVQYYHVPPLLGIILGLVMGIVVGWLNAFLTVTLGLPSFITTLGTGFILWGIVDTTSHAEPVPIPPSTMGVGKIFSTEQLVSSTNWNSIIWAVALTVIMHLVLTRTRWGLHTVAVGGNLLAAREAGIHVNRIKYGNFMLTGLFGALVGIQVAFANNSIDPTAGQYTPMFYSVAAAVIGGTAMLGGVGTIIGAFFGSFVIALVEDGFNILGFSANPLPIIYGTAILVAMIANVQLTRLRERGSR
ncbi:MAG: ABC transporter permease [Nocardiopsaceae bacterium]|nr:ABC transporter permease [Nocardiopsaceae bacterium]